MSPVIVIVLFRFYSLVLAVLDGLMHVHFRNGHLQARRLVHQVALLARLLFLIGHSALYLSIIFPLSLSILPVFVSEIDLSPFRCILRDMTLILATGDQLLLLVELILTIRLLWLF